MKNFFRKEMLKTWIVVIVSIVISVAALFIMPDTIPSHFGANGLPDAWGPKYVILLYPAVQLFVVLFAEPMKRMDPKVNNYGRFNKYYYEFFFGFALFFLFIEISNIAIAMGANINVGTIICFLVGVLMLFLGNMMPKIKQNFFFGIKTPWALSDEENWYKTHRLSAKVFVVAGIIIMAFAFLPGDAKILGILVAVVVMCLVPFAYSAAIHYRKKNGK